MIDDQGNVVAVPVTPVGTGILVGLPGFNMLLDTTGGAVTYEGSNIVLSSARTARSSGEGFLPGSEVEVWVFSTPTLLGTVTVDGNGTFSGDFPVPNDLPVGNHTLQAEGFNAQGLPRSVAVGVVLKGDDVSAPSSGLPTTGSDSVWLLVIGFFVVLSGGLLIFISRRALRSEV